ncbi:MAG: AAA family ATPase [Microcoleus sp. SIO2G3]|nr:AAA family ATPase [Microcoleus sp. SIO2G3]
MDISRVQVPPFETIFQFVDTTVYNVVGKHLSNIEVVVLQGSWLGQTYAEIASQNDYTLEYLKNDIGPQLWRRLSKALGEEVTKTNCRSVLRRWAYQEKYTSKKAEAEASVQQIAPKASEQETRSQELMTALNPFPQCSEDSCLNPAKLYHNLPPLDCTRLVGRKAEVQQLLEWLSFEHPIPRIAIQGTGGVGKTTLLLDVAHRCLQASQAAQQGDSASATKVIRSCPDLPTFEAIAFTCAKTQHFTNFGIVPRFRQEGTLREILRTIAHTLHCPDKPSASFAEAGDQILRCLEHRRMLLIVDNLDQLEERQDILSFLYELPATVKVVITSRECIPLPTIRLNALATTEALHLIQHQARERGMQLNLAESQMLSQTTGGIPAAIVYAISQLAMGYGLEEVPLMLQQPNGDFSRFYFERATKSLQGTPAQSLLIALALFSKPPTREAICTIAAVTDPSLATAGFIRLLQLSLIQLQHGRYTLPQLTRRFVLVELAAHPEFEQSIRERWVQWYLKLAREQGGKDWKEWQDYTLLEQEWENITNVIEWCITHDRYSEVCQLWRDVKCYTYSQGYRQSRLSCWDTPLDWLSWMIESAQTRKDWATVAELMGDRAWKLTLLEQPQHLLTASILFTQAWELRQHQTAHWQVELATHIAAWHLQQQQFSLAAQWLHQALSLLDAARLSLFDATRQTILIDYYRGEVYYKTREYGHAQVLFEQITAQAQSIGWQRVLFLAKDFLANIAIQQGELDKAQQLLIEGLQVVQTQHDHCSAAYIKRSLAKLEQKRGQLKAARRWATEAREDFEQLGMSSEAQETQTLLR